MFSFSSEKQHKKKSNQWNNNMEQNRNQVKSNLGFRGLFSDGKDDIGEK